MVKVNYMKTSEKGYNLIRQSEGFKLESYQDTGGVWTIGYGHTKGVVQGMNITEETAEKFLKQDVEHCERCLMWYSQDFTQGQYDACIDFIFNLGAGNFYSSTLFKKMKVGDYKGASDEFLKWIYGTVNGKRVKLPGLVTRRAKERELFNS